MGRNKASTPYGLVAIHVEVEEVAEHGDGRHHSHECLAVEGEDGQKEDKDGMEVERVDTVVVEDA